MVTRPTRRAPLLVALLVLACAGADDDAAAAGDTAATATAAPAAPQSFDTQLAEITSYELTMDRIDRLYAAQRNLALKAASMTEAEREAAAKAMGGDDQQDQQDIDGMARSIERSPIYAEAVRSAGFTPREYAVATYAMLQSAMAAGVAKMRPNDDLDSLAREMKASPANVRFMREHEAEITRKQQALAAEMKRLDPEGGN